MDIIVTTPKKLSKQAAQEAEDCKKAGRSYYFRRFAVGRAPKVEKGDRVFYVEDGHVRGFCLVDSVIPIEGAVLCETTCRKYGPGVFVYMDAKSWKWIRPIPMRGFQGFRYAGDLRDRVEVIGRWWDPKPLDSGEFPVDEDGHCVRCGCEIEPDVTHECPEGFRVSLFEKKAATAGR